MDITESSALCGQWIQRALLSLLEANDILTYVWKPGKHLLGSALKSS